MTTYNKFFFKEAGTRFKGLSICTNVGCGYAMISTIPSKGEQELDERGLYPKHYPLAIPLADMKRLIKFLEGYTFGKQNE